MKFNMIALIVKLIKGYHHKTSFLKEVTLLGKNYTFSNSASIKLMFESKKEDVVFEDNITFEGLIISQSHGKVYLSDWVKVGHGSQIMAVNSIFIGKYTAIATDVKIVDNNNHPVSPSYRRKMRISPRGSDMRAWKHSLHSPIVIGENVWIGSDVRINKGVTIGDNSIIAANSVVTKSIPSNTIAAGNPAKVVKIIEES